jgi:hypothetical protein
VETEARVRIVGDASKGVAASREISDAWGKAGAEMRAAFDRIKGSSRDAFLSVGRDANRAADEARQASRETVQSLRRIETASENMGRTTAAGFGLVKTAVAGLVAGVGIDSFVRLTSQGLEYAASLGEQAQQLGVTTTQLQEYRFAATQVGISQGEMHAGLAKLTRSLGEASLGAKKPIEALQRLGFTMQEIDDLARGTAGDALPKIADKLAAIESPAQRAAIEVDLFGKSGQKLDTLLAGGSAAIDNLREAARRLGVVLSEEQIARADETADKLAAVKLVLEANIAGAVANNAQAIISMANALATFVVKAIQAANAFVQFQKSTSGWSGFANDMGALVNIASGPTGWVKQAISPTRGGSSGGMDMKSFMQAGVKSLPVAPKFDLMPGTGAGVGGGGAKPKSSGSGASSDRIQGWQAELEERKLAFAKEMDAQGSFQQFSKQSEADYWADILVRQGLSQRERLSATKAYITAHQGVQREAFEATVDQYREDMEALRGNNAERLKLAESMGEKMKKAFGAESREYRAALRESARIQREIADEQVELAEEAAQARSAMALDAIEIEEEEARRKVELGLQTNRQFLQQLIQFEARRAEIRRQALQQEIEAMQGNPNHDPVALAKLRNQMLAVERQFHLRKRQIEIQAESQSTQRQRTAIQSLSQSWAGALARMATLQQGFATTVRQLWQGLVGAVVQMLTDMIAQYIAQWLIGLLVKKAASKVEAVSEGTKQVALAGAGGVASMAAAPFPLNLTAPAFGAAMSAAAAGFAAPAFAASGGFDIPSGINPVTQLHQREMVLPERFADVIRGMAEGGSRGAPGRGGDTYVIKAMDGRDVERVLMRNKSKLAKAGRAAARDMGRR